MNLTALMSPQTAVCSLQPDYGVTGQHRSWFVLLRTADCGLQTRTAQCLALHFTRVLK